MRWFKRLVAAAVLSMSVALAGVGASYGQTGTVANGFDKAGRPGLQGLAKIRISDVAGRPGT